YISIALLSAERLRGPPCSTETEFAANPEAIAMSGSDMDLWTTVTPQLPTRNSEEPLFATSGRSICAISSPSTMDHCSSTTSSIARLILAKRHKLSLNERCLCSVEV